MRQMIGWLVLTLAVMPASALDRATRERGEAVAARALAYLAGAQDASGGWNVAEGRPQLPAITALALQGFLMQPGIDAEDDVPAKAVAFLLRHRQADGAIFDRILPSYNTAISVSALSRVGTAESKAAVDAGIEFLRGVQWFEEADVTGSGAGTTGAIDRSHAFYGGVGYGGSSRPDNSNLHFFISAFADAGVDCEDPAVRRALVFLQRTQMLDEVNDMPYADGSSQGGFIYATSPNGDSLGVGESKAGMIDEVTPEGERVSRLRAYGSMTYAGFKSYVYAELDADDPRVSAARGWIEANYTLEENPGIGTDGYYYYLLTFGKALAALGEDTLRVRTDDGTRDADWRADLIDQLATLQNDDGSFRSVDDRWMENDPVLITAYSLIALQHALHE